MKLALDVWYEFWERVGAQGSEGWDEMKGLDEGDKRGSIQTRLRSSAEDTVEEAGKRQEQLRIAERRPGDKYDIRVG